MIVIPDRKTPAALYEAAAGARAEGISILCPDPGEQEQFLASPARAACSRGTLTAAATSAT